MSNQKLYTILIILSIILILPLVSFAQLEVSRAKAPETFEEATGLLWRIFETFRERLLGIVRNLWWGRVLPIWRQVYQLWSDFWDSYINPLLQSIWQRFLVLLGREVEIRKPQIEEELETEKEEIKEEVEEVKRTLWERLRDWIE